MEKETAGKKTRAEKTKKLLTGTDDMAVRSNCVCVSLNSGKRMKQERIFDIAIAEVLVKIETRKLRINVAQHKASPGSNSCQ